MSAQAQPQFALRPYLPQDAPMLAEIFRGSVEELTEDDYTPAQQEAWASLADDMEEFAARLAKLLYQAIEKLSAARGTPHLSVDASDTAREFFARRGFEPQQRNTVSAGNEWLSNTTMKKQLAAKGASA
jgi:putative acetyltransferase